MNAWKWIYFANVSWDKVDENNFELPKISMGMSMWVRIHMHI